MSLTFLEIQKAFHGENFPLERLYAHLGVTDSPLLERLNTVKNIAEPESRASALAAILSDVSAHLMPESITDAARAALIDTITELVSVQTKLVKPDIEYCMRIIKRVIFLESYLSEKSEKLDTAMKRILMLVIETKRAAAHG